MRKPPLASRLSFLFVVLLVGGSFFWWFKNRPAYLIYQAQSRIGKEDQAAVVAEYQRLLTRKDLPKEDELKLRKGLAEFYLKALDASGGATLSYSDEYDYIDPVLLTLKKGKYRVSQAADHPFLLQAKQECEKILALEPHDALGHCLMGWILWKRNLEKFAMEHFDASRRYDPNDARPLIYLSRIHLARNNAVLSRDLALQALAIAPGNDDAQIALLNAYDRLGDYGKMIDAYEALSENFKGIPVVRGEYALALAEQNEWNDSAREIDLALKAAPDDGWVKVLYGRILLLRGLPRDASGAFAQASALLPSNIWPIIWQAYAFARLGECDQIGRLAGIFYDYYEGAVDRAPVARLVTAWNHLCRGNEALALSELTEALRTAPDLTEALFLKADILMGTERFDELGELLRPLLDEKKNLGQATALLSESLYWQGHWDLAEETAEAAVQANDRYAWPLVWLGLVRGQKGEFESGERAFQQAMNLNKRDRDVQGFYWLFKALSGSAGEAEDKLSELVRDEQGNARLWMLLGDVQVRRKFYEEAIQSYQRALGVRPYLLRAQLGLVASFTALKQNDAARAALMAAIKVNPQNKDVASWRKKIASH